VAGALDCHGEDDLYMPLVTWEQTELATGFTVDDYKKAVTGQDRTAIAEFLMRRFAERYIDPISGKSVHGFTKMAVACLLVESVESFRKGWENSDRRSEAAFCYFFDEQPAFAAFRGYYAQFYRNVRCGILHQAETTGSWKITRKATAPLFDATSLTINADVFVDELRVSIEAFCRDLKTAAWNSRGWLAVRKKMKALCASCAP
jgi:hypothetical protein